MKDEPRMPDDFFMFINASRTFINSQPLLAQWKDAWDGRFETIIGRCIKPRQWWRVNSPRVKRGLFNFIEQASHFLFGTATSEEIDNVKDTLQQIGNNQAKLAHDITRFASVLNHTYEEIEITRKQLNSLTTKFELYVFAMDKNLRGNAEQVNRWTLRQDIEILISHV